LTATRRQGLPAIHEHATAHNAEVRGNTAEMHGISPSWITRVPRDWQVWTLQRSRDSERQRETERYIKLRRRHKRLQTQRASMHADHRMRCFASFERLLRPGCAEHEAPKLHRKSQCTRRAWTESTRAAPERALRQHEPSPERADARESTGARKRPEITAVLG